MSSPCASEMRDDVELPMSDDSDEFSDIEGATSKSPSPEPDNEPRPWLTNFPIGGSWDSTNAYVQRKDHEMLRYLQDFPTTKWLIGRAEANAAYRAMIDRADLRGSGLEIFSNGRPVWWPLRPVPQREYPMSTAVQSAQRHFPKSVTVITPLPPGLSLDSPVPSMSGALIPKAGRDAPRSSQPASRALRGPIPGISFAPGFAAQSAKQATTPAGSNLEQKGGLRDRPKRSSIARRHLANDAMDDEFVRPGPARPSTAISTRRSESTNPPYGPREPPLPDGTMEVSERTGRRVTHQTLRADEKFPWNEEYAAEPPMLWDDSIYPSGLLQDMERVRKRNIPRVARFELMPKQPKASSTDADIKTEQSPERQRHPKGATRKRQPVPVKDPDQSCIGSMRFVDDTDKAKCKNMGLLTVEDALDAAMSDPFNKAFAEIELFYDPGRKRIVEGLESVHMSLLDSARTRLQLSHFRVLSTMAAHRMIDFCPDLLWKMNLVRVISETDVSNKNMHERLGQNGAYTVVSSIAHRLTTGLSLGLVRGVNPEAAKEYKLQVREDFVKYRAYHKERQQDAQRRQLPSTFDLAEAARLYTARRAAEADDCFGQEATFSSDPSTMTEVPSRRSSSVLVAPKLHITPLAKSQVKTQMRNPVQTPSKVKAELVALPSPKKTTVTTVVTTITGDVTTTMTTVETTEGNTQTTVQTVEEIPTKPTAGFFTKSGSKRKLAFLSPRASQCPEQSDTIAVRHPSPGRSLKRRRSSEDGVAPLAKRAGLRSSADFGDAE